MGNDRVVADIAKNSREVVRITVGEFNGHKLAHVRVWTMGTDAKLVPTRSGLAIKVALLPELIGALEAAWTEASR